MIKTFEALIQRLADKNDAKGLLEIVERGKPNYPESDNSTFRVLAVQALGKLKFHSVVEPLIGMLKPNPAASDKDYVFQNDLIFALGDIGDEKAFKPLVKLLLHADELRIRWTSAFALAKLNTLPKDQSQIDPLIGILRNSRQETSIRNMVAWTLLQIGNEHGDLAIIQYMKTNLLDDLKKVLLPDEQVKL